MDFFGTARQCRQRAVSGCQLAAAGHALITTSSPAEASPWVSALILKVPGATKRPLNDSRRRKIGAGASLVRGVTADVVLVRGRQHSSRRAPHSLENNRPTEVPSQRPSVLRQETVYKRGPFF